MKLRQALKIAESNRLHIQRSTLRAEWRLNRAVPRLRGRKQHQDRVVVGWYRLRRILHVKDLLRRTHKIPWSDVLIFVPKTIRAAPAREPQK